MKNKKLFAISLLTFILCLGGCSDNNKTSTKEESKYEVIENYITCKDQRKIYTRIYKPINIQNKTSTIIMSHGYSMTNADVKKDAEYFSSNGYVCVIFDYCGGSTISKSDGSTENMTIETEFDDLDEVFNYTITLDYVDSSSVILFGCSQGGFMSTFYASRNVDKIKGLLLYYPSYCIPEKAVDGSSASKGEKYNEVAKKYYPVEDTILKPVKDMPILIFHGDNDHTVDLHYSQDAMKIFTNAELVVIPGAGHGFTMFKMGTVLDKEIHPKGLAFLNNLTKQSTF